MPQRTNAFQALVLLLHQELGTGAHVSEGRFLENRLDGARVEVDVVVEHTVGGYPVIISIECIDRGRAATREWVDQMRGKHEHLPTNKLVLISRAGFSKRAKGLADRLGIDTYRLSEASALDWTRVVNKLGTIISEVLHSELKAFPILDVPDEIVTNTVMSREQLLSNADGTAATTVGTVLDTLTTAETGRVFMDYMRDSNLQTNAFTMVFTLPNPMRIAGEDGTVRNCEQMFITDHDGTRHAIRGLRVVFNVQKSQSTIPLKHGMLKEIPVSYGDAKGTNGTLRVAIVELELGGTKILTTEEKKGKSQPVINVDQSSGNCMVTELRRTIGRETAEGSIAVTAPAHGDWKAITDVPWIIIQNASGIGPATVRFSVTSNNSTKDRVGNITVGVTTCVITQTAQNAEQG